MPNNKKFAVVGKPDSQSEIDRLVERLLRMGDAVDVFPTPMGRLFEVAKFKTLETCLIHKVDLSNRSVVKHLVCF